MALVQTRGLDWISCLRHGFGLNLGLRVYFLLEIGLRLDLGFDLGAQT